MRLSRRLGLLVSALAVLAAATVQTASAAPHMPHVGGLRPGEAPAATGDCELSGVTCKPSRSVSCTGYSSQTSPPTTIRVAVRTSSTGLTINTVDFEIYVEDVLPNEWAASWDGDALKAGAVAVKSYAWYWVTHFGGYLGSTATSADCFDVTDDQDFQVYLKDSRLTNQYGYRTTSAVEQTWPVAARYDGRIVQTQYRAYLGSSAASEGCAKPTTGVYLSQWGSQRCNESSTGSTGNKYNVILGYYYFKPVLQYATTQQLRTAHDFQYLRKSTPVTFNAGHWGLADGYGTTFRYGQSGDIPTVTTTGDGFAHIGVYRPSTGTWYIGSPTGGTAARVVYGARTDTPVQAQYNGLDQPTVLAVFRPSTGYWYEATSSGGTAARIQYGVTGDIPVPGRYTSTTADQIAVFRPSNGTWYVRGGSTVRYGQRGDIPVPADYDGNGTTDIAIYRPSTHRFYVQGKTSVQYGTTGDVPVTGDFNGDGKADFAVYRPSTHTWYVLGGTSVVLGSSGATPIGKAPYHD